MNGSLDIWNGEPVRDRPVTGAFTVENVLSRLVGARRSARVGIARGAAHPGRLTVLSIRTDALETRR